MTAPAAFWHTTPAIASTLCSDCLGDIRLGDQIANLATRRLSYRKGPRKGQERVFCARCATDDRARQLSPTA